VRFLRRFDAILFDLNGTLAEDYDRFDGQQDYTVAYIRHGGSGLDAEALAARIGRGLTRLTARYDAAPADPFPALREFLIEDELPETEIRALEATVAVHEMGSIPAARIRLLEQLAGSHRIGLISDLWAPAAHYRRYLASIGLGAVFASMVFSCEHGAVKPSPRLFLTALRDLDVAPGRAVFVGDNPSRDIAGAAACGLATIWVCRHSETAPHVHPDRTVGSVEALVDLV
jgi:FMN phosphatase YigB (HAD superfamily)